MLSGICWRWGRRPRTTVGRAAIDEGHVPQCGMPVLGLIALCVCIALQWAACLAVHESHVAHIRGMWEGPLGGLPVSEPVWRDDRAVPWGPCQTPSCKLAVRCKVTWVYQKKR